MVAENERANKRDEKKPHVLNPPPPHSPLRKRILSIPSSFKKKNNNNPTFTHCHCCGLNGYLQLLSSHWRLLLLCRNCLLSIRSGDICSYCFDEIDEEKDLFFNCLRCLRRIHYICIPSHPYYILPMQLDVESFTCVDCCPIPKSVSGNKKADDEVDAVAEALEPLDLVATDEKGNL